MVIVAINSNTDIGQIMENNKFGYWSESGDLDCFNQHIERLSKDMVHIKEYGLAGFEYLKANYTVDQSYHIIKKHLV